MNLRSAIPIVAIASGVALGGNPHDCLSQQPPDASTVSVIVPFPAGTITDVVARLYAKQLSEIDGKKYVVVNRPGAGGAVGTQALLSAPPNGQTIMFVSSAHAVTPALNSKLPFDTTRDLAGVALVGATPTVIVVNPGSNVRTQQDLLALARRRELTYGSAGIGSAAHFACEHFAAQASIKLLHVPYKGSNEYVMENVAGRVDMSCPPVAAVAQQVSAGKLVAVSIASEERSPMLPNAPTTKEAGLADATFEIWYGVVVSKSVPSNVVQALAQQIKVASHRQEITQALKSSGIASRSLLGPEFDAFISAEIQKYRELVKKGGIEVQ